MSLVIAAGGTGGHVFPALAVAQAWQRHWPEQPIYWIGVTGGREAAWIEPTGIPWQGVPSAGWQPHLGWRNLRLVERLPRATKEVHRLLKKYQPRVLFTTGGYPGLLPGLWAAIRGVPLVLLELNWHAGRTIRWLSRWAARIYGAFPQTAGVQKPSEWLGVPVRFTEADRSRFTAAEAKALWQFPPDRPMVLVLGGSQGSSALNRAVASAAPKWIAAGATLLWQVGRENPSIEDSAIRTLPFIENMIAAYSAADIVVSRAGGSTLGELAWWAKPAVLVPSPHVAEDHQRKNAQYWQDHGAATLVEETDESSLCTAVLELLQDPSLRAKRAAAAGGLARPDAAEVLARALHELAYGTA